VRKITRATCVNGARERAAKVDAFSTVESRKRVAMTLDFAARVAGIVPTTTRKNTATRWMIRAKAEGRRA